MDVTWDVRGDFKRPVTLRVLTADRPGLLADMSNIFSKKGVNISQANCRATGDDRAVNTFEVTISDLKQLTDLMQDHRAPEGRLLGGARVGQAASALGGVAGWDESSG